MFNFENYQIEQENLFIDTNHYLTQIGHCTLIEMVISIIDTFPFIGTAFRFQNIN